jgi:hypothetical protein
LLPDAFLQLRARAQLELLARLENRVRYRTDPVAYCHEVLGIRTWSRQEEILRAIADKSTTAVRSGHKVSKSTTLGCAALWFWDCFDGARVICTAPTYRQVRSIIWREVRGRYKAARVPLGGKLNELPDRGLQHADGREIVGFSTKEPERMAGISGPNVMFLCDEASGIPQPIFEAIEGNRAGGAKLVLTSNATQTSGYFFDAFHGQREFFGALIHISSWEAAEVEGIPGLARREWCDEKLRSWGKDSPLYHVRVLGNFPAQSSNAVISLAAVTNAVEAWDDVEPDRSQPLVLGVDPARFGDDETIIQPRRGNYAYPAIAVSQFDEQAVADKVLEVTRAMRGETEPPPRVHVDGHGIGAGVVSVLRQAVARKEMIVSDVRSGDPSDLPDKYFNLRSQIAFAIGEWLAEGGVLPDDSKLQSELVAPTYSFDERGRQKVESKKDIKARLGRSPDRMDALALAVYMPYGDDVGPGVGMVRIEDPDAVPMGLA